MNPLAWIRRTASVLGPFVALIALLVVFRLAAGASFWGWFNLQNILTQTVLVAVGAVGMTVIIVAGGIDLSCGAALALAAVLCARVLAPESAPAADASAHERWWTWLASWPDWSAIPLAIALPRSSRNSSSCARSRAACSSKADTSGRGSSAP